MLGLVGAKEERTREAQMSGIGMVPYLSRLDEQDMVLIEVRKAFAGHNCGCFCDVKN